MKELPFRANGHRCQLADGAVATVFDDLGLPAHLTPWIPRLGSARSDIERIARSASRAGTAGKGEE